MPIYKGSTNQGLIYYGTPNTNCITSVPKNIKLELINGVLTLKAGSKVYVPNGKNADGSLKFDEYITSSDIVDTDFGNDSKEFAFLVTNDAAQFSVWPNTLVVSGTSTPDFSGNGYWGVWYDTANNIIKTQDGSNEWKTSYGFSLPFCLVSSSSSAVTSVDQIFDWCGYIGSTQFFLPGIKGLKSNGLKADGTYNNIEIETKSVLLNQYDYTTSNQQVGIGGGGNYPYRTNAYHSQATAPAVTPYSVWHNTKDNFNYYIGADTSPGWVKELNFDFQAITSISTDSSFKITSLTPAKIQPLRTGIPITKVYKGSVLVYEKYATDINWKTDGTYTGVDIYNGQYTLTLHVRSASSDYTLAEVHGAGTYSGTITRGRQPRVNYWNMYCVLYYIDGTSETVWQETSCPEGTATFNVNFVAKKPFNRVLWSLNYNPSDSVYCDGWLGPVGNWTLV